MKKSFVILITLLLFSCQSLKHISNRQSTDSLSSGESATENRGAEFAAEVRYTKSYMPDTMYTDINGQEVMITKFGKAFKKGSVPYFDLRCKNMVEELFIYKEDDEIIAFFTDTDEDYGASFAKRINPENNKIIWSTPIYGFNLGKPLIVDNKAYVSTIGFVGKIDLSTGKFVWKFEDLYKDGKYNSFNTPEFYENDMVLFPSYDSKKQKHSILIDDKKGKIVKMD